MTGRQRARAGEEPGVLGVLRTKLLQFLRSSRHYKAAEHISSLPDDGQQLFIVFITVMFYKFLMGCTVITNLEMEPQCKKFLFSVIV